MQTQTMQKTKTKTAVAIALGVALFGTVGFAAGLYYYGQRIDFSGSKANCNCPACPVCPKCATTDTSETDSEKDTPSDSGTPDLNLSKSTGMRFSAYDAGMKVKFSATITNQGNASTATANACANKQIAVKVYQSSNGSTSGTPIGATYINDLAVGQTLSLIVPTTLTEFCSIHSWCTFIVKVDADGCVTESNEANNIRGSVSYRGR